jgi:hypothetical protein
MLQSRNYNPTNEPSLGSDIPPSQSSSRSPTVFCPKVIFNLVTFLCSILAFFISVPSLILVFLNRRFITLFLTKSPLRRPICVYNEANNRAPSCCCMRAQPLSASGRPLIPKPVICVAWGTSSLGTCHPEIAGIAYRVHTYKQTKTNSMV